MTRVMVFAGLMVTAALMATATVFAYGKWYGHNRYWHGTIERVQHTQAQLVHDLLLGMQTDSSLFLLPDRLDAMFASLRSKLIVEVFSGDEPVFSNDNGRFARGIDLNQ